MIHKLQSHTYVLLYNTYNLDLLFMSTYIKIQKNLQSRHCPHLGKDVQAS